MVRTQSSSQNSTTFPGPFPKQSVTFQDHFLILFCIIQSVYNIYTTIIYKVINLLINFPIKPIFNDFTCDHFPIVDNDYTCVYGSKG